MGQILVTGASGWLGKSSISYLLKNNFTSNNIIPAASTKKSITIDKFGTFHAEDFFNFETEEKVDGIIHLSFLTRDKLNEISFPSYVEINQNITIQAAKLVKKLKPNWVVNVSSGAIFNPKTKKIEENLDTNPYGFLKAFEERELNLATQEIGANLVIGRLWGASGTLMPLNRAYALSDFIYQALTDKKIVIQSNKQVFRRYVDSEMFMGVLIESALVNQNCVIDSGGPVVEIGKLASIVAESLDVHEISRPPILDVEIDDYYPRSEQFEEVAIEFNLPISSIYEQVANTILGHRRSI